MSPLVRGLVVGGLMLLVSLLLVTFLVAQFEEATTRDTGDFQAEAPR